MLKKMLNMRFKPRITPIEQKMVIDYFINVDPTKSSINLLYAQKHTPAMQKYFNCLL